MKSDRFFDLDFVVSFTVLMAHTSHNPKVHVIISNWENEEIEPSQLQSLPENTEMILSIVLNSSHFAVVCVKVKDCVIEVLDGLTRGGGMVRWNNHIDRILKRRKLITLDTKFSEGKFGKFRVTHRELVSQRDGHNCGPIACGTVWSIIKGSEFQVKQHSGDDLRVLTVQQYKKMIERCATELNICRRIRRTEAVIPKGETTVHQDQVITKGETTVHEDQDICCFCYSGNEKSSLSCTSCKNRFHCECLLNWFDCSPKCPLCRFELNAEEVQSQLDAVTEDPTCTTDSNREGLIQSPLNTSESAAASHDPENDSPSDSSLSPPRMKRSSCSFTGLNASESDAASHDPENDSSSDSSLSPPRMKRSSSSFTGLNASESDAASHDPENDSSSDSSLGDLVLHRQTKLRNNMATAARRQEKQGKAMKAQFVARSVKVDVGSIVSLKVDIRDRSQCNPCCIIAIVFEVIRNTGGFRAVCEHGVIGTTTKKKHFFSYGGYSKLSDNQTISQALAKIQRDIIDGSFVESDYDLISMKKAQAKSLGHKTNGRRKCKCKHGRCGPICGCRRNNSYCNSSCGCGGRCQWMEDKFAP
jgi:hypothetical protein